MFLLYVTFLLHLFLDASVCYTSMGVPFTRLPLLEIDSFDRDSVENEGCKNRTCSLKLAFRINVHITKL
jgi:hypothetical protein